jgi:hypothetical protein
MSIIVDHQHFPTVRGFQVLGIEFDASCACRAESDVVGDDFGGFGVLEEFRTDGYAAGEDFLSGGGVGFETTISKRKKNLNSWLMR